MKKSGYMIGLLVLLLAACGTTEEEPRPTEIRVVTNQAPTQDLEVGPTQAVAVLVASPMPTATLGEVIGEGTVISQQALLLAEPDSNATELASLPQDTTVTIIGESDPDRIGVIFYQVQFNGQVGWIPSTQLSLVPEEAGNTPSSNQPSPTSAATQRRSPTPFPSSTPMPTIVPTTTPTPLPPGFPTPEIYSLVMVEQLFERGRMIWLEPLREIWVLEGDSIDPREGTWSCFVDTFVDGLPESDPNLDPPANTTTASNFDGAVPMQPVRGFGKIWRENFDIREALGWAITPETMHTSRYEYRADGTLRNNRFQAGPGEIRVLSLFRYTMVFQEDLLRAPCDKKAGTWEIE